MKIRKIKGNLRDFKEDIVQNVSTKLFNRRKSFFFFKSSELLEIGTDEHKQDVDVRCSQN